MSGFDAKVVINLDHLAHNFNQAAEAAPQSKVMAVVKADAYGHGALQVANAGSGAFGWLSGANKVLTISDSLSYDESLDTRFASDVTWRFGVNGLDDADVDSVLPNHSHPSALSEHDEQLRQLDSCLVGMTQPVVLPPLPLPPLKQ